MPIPVYIDAADPVTAAAVREPLKNANDIAETRQRDRMSDTVFVVATQDEPGDALARVAALHEAGCKQIVLVTRGTPASDLLHELGDSTALVVRNEDLSERLVTTIRRAGRSSGSDAGANEALTDQPGHPAIPGSPPTSHLRALPRPQPDLDLSDRERQILRLAAEGFDTREIARELAFSQRTVKGAIRDVTRRYGLKNRCHAVAYAIRHGAI